uniref:Aldehyde dehydrogenase n=1 Tax=Globisporangium ultimum (strain ATCC 200006 / CBS 805.95 / DAOM BR144) TaxID=431595 RepID=K3X9P3_GLOUD
MESTTIASSAESIVADVQALRAAFRSGVTRDFAARRQQLVQLRRLIDENLGEISDALWKDMHKNPIETKVCEVGLVMMEIQEHLDFLEEWSQPERVGTNIGNLPGQSYIYKESLGVVSIIGTWNYPIQLTLTPLVGALSAGNTVLLRLPGSDTCVHTTQVLAKLVAKYMDNRFVRTVSGGVEASKIMLEQKFDLIFCTGGEFIGKIVAEAAAKHLTPTILELGGKSPCIVDETCDLTIAARRIAWGGFMNAGQTCVRPDYIMVSKKIGDKLVAEIEKELLTFFGKDPQKSDSYCRIVNERSYTRVSGLLANDTKHVTCGGAVDAEDRFIAPTLLNFKTDFASFDKSAVMSQEIFGPLLPIYYYDTLDEAIAYVNDHPKPLALYVFTTNSKNREKVLTETTSGGVSVNDTIVHLSNPNLPFGGVGASGMGAYHGKHSFDAFTHKKGVQFKYNILDAPQRYMPYNKSAEFVLAVMLAPIPHRYIKTAKYAAFALLFAVIGMLVKRNGSRFPALP